MVPQLTGRARAVATLAVLTLTSAFVQGCDRAGPSGHEDPITVTVSFEEDAPGVAMISFFEGFNAGRVGGDGHTSSFNVKTRERKMTVNFTNSDAAEWFTSVAENSEIVESVDAPATR